MGESQQVKTVQEALEIARAFAGRQELNGSTAEAYAETWFDAGKDFDKASADDLRAYLTRRFDLS